jgi:hypothetical protein
VRITVRTVMRGFGPGNRAKSRMGPLLAVLCTAALRSNAAADPDARVRQSASGPRAAPPDILHQEHAPCYTRQQAFHALTDGKTLIPHRPYPPVITRKDSNETDPSMQPR